MSKPPQVLVAAILCLLALAALPAFGADVFTFEVEGAFVVGDQVYDGGTLRLSRVGHGGLMALELNGRHIGLLRTRDYGPLAADAKPYLVFRKVGKSTLWRLSAVRLRPDNSQQVRVVRIDPLDLLPGFATVPNADGSTALAKQR
jgi:hypothetical protein